ncbi:necrosis inducing [Gonapodya prolifera JEL478]|uniref:Necrosis inducing n=1 Tax=Gonapodya prolifera (strain JEL478) TaxID=1344416 RepID=A0A139AGN0_GONPJ|nr:necrosis inducing [Gonapodya prolifera JEL478]|eukprot:KXS15849.1 necrosis inducing [Gonapodya prolifera JEL478]
MDIATIAPVFDFDKDGCLPSAAISRAGAQNGGLKTTGSLGGGCRKSDFMAYSNTYHRATCADSEGKKYCAHFYSLYFQKDQVIAGLDSFGHRHDIESVSIWTTNGAITHVGASAHGDMNTRAFSDIDKQDGHAKIVYHKDGIQTHAFRFSKSGEKAENSYDTFVTPPIVDWDRMVGDGLDNAAMRDKLNGFNFGSAHFPILDGDFLRNVNDAKPEGYPTFTSLTA